ncbi:MAG: DEAD/DEAH box helicase family protein [Candidatus Cloacimonetes bacterium]|nr:DEAD/DEAH box helicase family protein [Candidatus Cloacimonadota bacterium]
MSYLYREFESTFASKFMEETDVPKCITDNLRHPLRPYQIEAFKRFVLYESNDIFTGKRELPFHILYNMATGSGKTLIMAGLILYLYTRGYRNFIFFVNTTNIILKTKDNFLNSRASKYLFSQNIVIDNKQIYIKEMSNFDDSDQDNISIKFTTIQQLHLDLTNTKENGITYEDLIDKKIVLIADEAHHLNVATRKQITLNEINDGGWEATVIKILNQNIKGNLLCEFTATIDLENPSIRQKYTDKIIYKYDLADYRKDKYSKEINLLCSQYDEKERILQALILNLYRQLLALENGINLKPVILFKAKRTIEESENNKETFHSQIESLSQKDIQKIRETSAITIVQKAFLFFKERNLADTDIVSRLQFMFKPSNCLSANNESETDKNQILLNTLEDQSNPIRAIFAVQKLNEGWDVLNLFDIVRLYTERDTGGKTIGKTTIAEAQLIGRGARYFPFIFPDKQDKYKRKFDDDLGNDMRVIEELYYHTKEDNRYISELKRALVQSGIYDDRHITRQLKLKDIFKQSEFYQWGYVYLNEKIPKKHDSSAKLHTLQGLKVAKKNISCSIASGLGYSSNAFTNKIIHTDFDDMQDQKDFSLADMPYHVIRSAVHQNKFFRFDNLCRYLCNLCSIRDFIQKHLQRLEITFVGSKGGLRHLSHSAFFNAIAKLLQEIEIELNADFSESIGTEFKGYPIHQVFKDKEINIEIGTEREKGQQELVSDKEWYVFDANYGTTEEKKFVEMFHREYSNLKTLYDYIYLIRNERQVKIYSKNGQAFEPDFLLFCIDKKGVNYIHQVFIEPKGDHLRGKDAWKNDFLRDLNKEHLVIPTNIAGKEIEYTITAVPFYTSTDENDFKKSLRSVLSQNSY